MDRHTCKLCFRRFQNGRALGGHMRSHVMAAAAAAYSPVPPPISLASTSSTEADDVSGVVRDSSKQCFTKVRAPEFSCGGTAGGDSSIVQDGQSDTESSPRGGRARFAVSRRRSKRARRRAQPDPEPASSVSDATPDEDVAMSLVMLSRDSWTRSGSEHDEQHCAPARSEPEQNNGTVGSFDARGRFQCGACRKVFRSYQALGGHRASIRKCKGGCVPAPAPPPPSPKPRHADVTHECPSCFRVFASGQALGGHKRAHMAPAAGASSSSRKRGDSSGSIDLNVSAAAADDDFELSAVYDAEFGIGSTTKQ